MKTREVIQALQSCSSDEPRQAVVNAIRQRLSKPVASPGISSMPGSTTGGTGAGIGTGMKLLISVGLMITAGSIWYIYRSTTPTDKHNQRAEIEQPIQQLPQSAVSALAEEAPVIAGYVSLPDGTAPEEAWVWIEPVLDPYPNFWHQRANDPTNAYKGRMCTSDTIGYFEFIEEDWPDRFIVKAVPDGYPAAISDIIISKELPKTDISIGIDTSGGVIIGTLKNEDGYIITNATLNYDIEKPGLSEGVQRQEVAVPIIIESDGSFTSGKIPAGKYNTYFCSKGYYYYQRPVLIRDGEIEIADVSFRKRTYIAVTGIVYNAETDSPLNNVEIYARDFYQGTQVVHQVGITDNSGQFLVTNLSKSYYPLLVFRHPTYGSHSRTFSHNECSSGPVEVRLSYGAPVRVRVYKYDGTPAAGYKVRRSDEYLYYYTDEEGETVIVCEPEKPVRFLVCERPMWRTIDVSRLLTPKYRVFNDCTIYLPPMGSLHIEIPPDVDYDSLKISCFGISESGSVTNNYSQRHCTVVSNRFILSPIHAGKYSIMIKGNYLAYLATNVSVCADETTSIVYNTNTNNNGCITGVVKDSNNIMVPCEITLLNHTTREKIDTQWSGSRGMMHEDTTPFIFSNLNPANVYDISVHLATATNLEIYGIVPNGPPLEIMAPDVYKITGKIDPYNDEEIDLNITIYKEDYVPYVGSDSKYEAGEFFWYPLIPGTYYIEFWPNSAFVPQVRKVTIVDSDVDIGTIVFDSGITVRWKTVDDDNQPITNCYVIILTATEKPREWMQSSELIYFGENGISMSRHLPRDHVFLLKLEKNEYSLMKEIGPFSTDTDLGTLTMKKRQYIVATLKDSTGQPVPGTRMMRTTSDQHGIWHGIAPARPYLQFSKANKRFHVPYWPTTAPTNYITVTVPNEFSTE